MPARYREADDRAQHTGQYFYYLGGTTSRNSQDGEMRTCQDVVNNFPNVNPFESHRRWTVRGRISGEQWNDPHTTLLRKLTAFPVDRVATARDPRSYYGSLDIPAIQALLRGLLNSTSPSQPHVSLPTSLGELKDFKDPVLNWAPGIFRRVATAPFLTQLRKVPELIKAFGNTLIGWVSNGYITYRWVVRPMISDLRKMCDFVNAVEKRWKYLARLARGETVRRRVSVSNDTATVNQTRAYLSTGQGFQCQVDWAITYTSKVWGSAKWKLSSSAGPLPKDAAKWTSMVRRLTAGVTSFELLKTAWELTPWSWFADWFGDLGANIALYNNSVQAYWADACIMRTLTSKVAYTVVPGTLPGWAFLVQEPVEQWTLKQRFNDLSLWLPLLPTTLPLLDGGKWSILGALAASSVDRGLPGIRSRWWGR